LKIVFLGADGDVLGRGLIGEAGPIGDRGLSGHKGLKDAFFSNNLAEIESLIYLILKF
jgi:hypothetical protein